MHPCTPAPLHAPLQLRLSECGPAGRGLVTTRRVAAGERLLALPASLLLTAEQAARGEMPGHTAQSSLLVNSPSTPDELQYYTPKHVACALLRPAESCLAPLLRSGAAVASPEASREAPSPLPLPADEWSLLALYLAELRARVAAGDVSAPLSAYVAALPQRPGTVLEWPEGEVRAGSIQQGDAGGTHIADGRVPGLEGRRNAQPL
jgi:hypothetical protein